MPDTTLEDDSFIPDNIADLIRPVITPLPEHPFVPCDGHENASIQALFSVKLVTMPDSAEPLSMCGNCAYRHFGRHSSQGSWMANESKSKGEVS